MGIEKEMVVSQESRSFEQALKELEECVEKLGESDIPLEESLQTFEKGVALTKECQTLLTQAKHRVLELREQGSQIKESEKKS